MRIFFLLLISFSASATNYVVIGAFAKKENAVKLSQKQKAEYEINPIKQLYYVFVLKTEDLQEALSEAQKLQNESEFKDAWVFHGKLGQGGEGEDIMVVKEPDIKQPEPAKQDDTSPASPSSNPDYEKSFFFKTTDEYNHPYSDAEITVIEPKSQRKEYVLKPNENVILKAVNQTGDIRIECDLVGFRKIIQTINFKDPSTIEGVTMNGNTYVVPLVLVPVKKGDFAILYNVFFYKDAAIMRPESKPDLDRLLAMMNSNPRYKIRIHGHTNGNAAGAINEVGESGDLFSLAGAKEGHGSAKKLSAKRAEAIRAYLMQNGIEGSRMETKAWGGKKPIYDKLATQASANVRVEVEVLEE